MSFHLAEWSTRRCYPKPFNLENITVAGKRFVWTIPTPGTLAKRFGLTGSGPDPLVGHFAYVGRLLASSTQTVHTSTMSLKTASFLALIGTILLTALLAWDFVRDLMNIAGGLVAPVMVFRSVIYLVAALTVSVFFYTFHKAQA